MRVHKLIWAFDVRIYPKTHFRMARPNLIDVWEPRPFKARFKDASILPWFLVPEDDLHYIQYIQGKTLASNCISECSPDSLLYDCWFVPYRLFAAKTKWHKPATILRCFRYLPEQSLLQTCAFTRRNTNFCHDKMRNHLRRSVRKRTLWHMRPIFLVTIHS